MGRTHTREAVFGRADPDTREVPLTLSTSTPVDRGSFWEVLDHRPGAVDLSRSPLPLIESHDTRRLNIAVVDDLHLANGRLRGVARFGSSARADEVLKDVRGGIVRGVSVGYQYLDDGVQVGERDRRPIIRFKFQPVEVSAVSVPADVHAGFFRSHPQKGNKMDQQIQVGDAGDFDNEQPRLSRSQRRAASEAAAAAEAAAQRATASELRRVRDINALGDKFARWGGAELAREAVESGDSFDDFRQRVLSAVEARQTPADALRPTPSEPGSFGGAPAGYGTGARESFPGLKLRAFADTPEGRRTAYGCGMWLKARIGGDGAARQWVADNMGRRALGEGIPSLGGTTVPSELAAVILTKSEEFGVMRQVCRNWPMQSATLDIPRNTAGLSLAFIGENSSITAQNTTFDQVSLNAKKAGGLVLLSRELVEDAAPNVADYLASEFARVLAETQDKCALVGNGTSTYGGMTGIVTRLESAAHAGGRATAAANHDTLVEFDAADLGTLMALLPARAQRNASFVCSSSFWGNVFARLMISANGSTMQDLAQSPVLQFMGRPVHLVPGDVLPSGATTDYSSKVVCLYGDFNMAAAFGIRREIEIRTLTELFAQTDQIGVQMTSRFDFVAHDVGDTTAPGAVVGLYGN